MARLEIGQVAARSGVAASAIRYYEREGLIPRAERRGGRRVFDESIFERLALIDLAKRAGFTVAEIAQLLSAFTRRAPPGRRWRRLAESKLVELDARIAEAERMKEALAVVMACRCPTLEECGARCGRAL